MAIDTFNELKQAVGKNIKYYDTTSGWVTGRDVTEGDIGEALNTIYLQELVPMIMSNYPHYYRQIARANSWIANGTVDATSTGTTLVATTAIFTNSMEKLYVWNDTDEELATIETFTNTTTVTLDTTIGDTWDGDDIYILGQEFTFGGDMADVYTIEIVGIKYNADDDYYMLAGNPRPKFDIFQYGGERWSKSSPQTYMTTVNVGGVPKDAVGILPKFDKKITNAIEINYVGTPAEMSADADVPRLPSTKALIFAGTAWAFRQRQLYNEADRYEALYMQERKRMMAHWKPTATSTARVQRLPRRFTSLHRRRL